MPRALSCVSQIRAGSVVLFEDTVHTAGTRTVTVRLPRPRRVSLQITMTNEHGQRYWDVVSLAFNTQFYGVLKWMLAGPFVLAAALLFCLTQPPPAGPGGDGGGRDHWD